MIWLALFGCAMTTWVTIATGLWEWLLVLLLIALVSAAVFFSCWSVLYMAFYLGDKL